VDKDFEFAKSFLQDSHTWKLIGNKMEGNVNTYHSTLNYLPNVTMVDITTLKHECILPLTLSQCLLSYFSNETIVKFEPNLTFIETEDYHTISEVDEHFKDKPLKYKSGLAITSAHFNFGSMFTPRYYKFSTAMHYDEKEKTVIQFFKSYFEEKPTSIRKTQKMEFVSKVGLEPVNVKAYPIFNFMIGVFKKIDEQKVSFTQIHFVDLNAWISSSKVVRVIAHQRGESMRKSILQLAQQFPVDARISDYDYSKKVNGKYVDGIGMLLSETKIEPENLDYQKRNNTTFYKRSTSSEYIPKNLNVPKKSEKRKSRGMGFKDVYNLNVSQITIGEEIGKVNVQIAEVEKENYDLKLIQKDDEEIEQLERVEKEF
jgi:hypothetical protein